MHRGPRRASCPLPTCAWPSHIRLGSSVPTDVWLATSRLRPDPSSRDPTYILSATWVLRFDAGSHPISQPRTNGIERTVRVVSILCNNTVFA